MLALNKIKDALGAFIETEAEVNADPKLQSFVSRIQSANNEEDENAELDKVEAFLGFRSRGEEAHSSDIEELREAATRALEARNVTVVFDSFTTPVNAKARHLIRENHADSDIMNTGNRDGSLQVINTDFSGDQVVLATVNALVRAAYHQNEAKKGSPSIPGLPPELAAILGQESAPVPVGPLSKVIEGVYAKAFGVEGYAKFIGLQQPGFSEVMKSDRPDLVEKREFVEQILTATHESLLSVA